MKGTFIEKFQKFYKKLNETEQLQCYNLMTVVRGPPSMNNRNFFKDQITSKVRWILFGQKLKHAFTNSEPISQGLCDALEEWIRTLGPVEFQGIPLPRGYSHYFSHAKRALDTLKSLGYEFKQEVKEE